MNTNRGLRFLAAALALLLLPVLARAEVSVSVDRQGNVKRIFFLTRGSGHGAQYWSQVRSYLRPEVVLNPLGDTYGDGAPVIQQDPRTRRPLVVWPHNAGNVKQLVFSAWTGRGWSDPAPVVSVADPYHRDQVEPALAIDAAGAAYLVWTRMGQGGRIYFSTFVRERNAWTPAMPLSAEGVDARKPSVAVKGTIATVTYETLSGTAMVTYDSAVLLDSAVSLMDSPTPPLDSPSGGGSGDDSGAPLVKRR